MSREKKIKKIPWLKPWELDINLLSTTSTVFITLISGRPSRSSPHTSATLLVLDFCQTQPIVSRQEIGDSNLLRLRPPHSGYSIFHFLLRSQSSTSSPISKILIQGQVLGFNLFQFHCFDELAHL